MTILHRQMLKEVLAAVALSTGGFLFVMVVGNLVKEYLPDVIAGRLPWDDFFKIMAMLIPGVAPYILPVGTLTGVLLVLGRLSSQNEITAMKAAGLSLARIVAPIVAIGVGGALFSAAINFQYSPRMKGMIRNMAADSMRGGRFLDYIPVKTAFPFPAFNGDTFTLYTDSKSGGMMHHVWIWRTDASGRNAALYRAESAAIVYDEGDPNKPDDDRLRIALTKARVESFEGSAIPTIRSGYFETMESPDLRPGGFLRNETRIKKIGDRTFPELMAMRADAEKLPDPEKRFAERIRVQLQIQSSLAGAFGILSLTLLAIPLGIRVARSETFVNMAVALGLAVAYYFATVSFQWIRNPHLRPDILVWIPNLVVQAVAIRLFAKASRT